jgi:hypothetical protein
VSHEDEDEDDGYGRHETPLERADRNLNELLQELRVAQTGIQVLFAFLLTVPFTQRFPSLTSFERTTYFATLLLSALGALLLIAPTAYHRVLFHQGDKPHIVRVSNNLAIAGLTCVGAAMTGVVMLVSSVLYGPTVVAVVSALIAVLWLSLWHVLPGLRRLRIDRGAVTSSDAELHPGASG